MSKEGLNKVKEMAKDIDFCMFVTQEEDDTLRSRPMSTTQVDDNGTMWFFTDEYSGKVDEFQDNRSVNLAYSKISGQDYLSVSGKASLVTNQDKIRQLWSPMLKVWFPDGLETEGLALIKVTPTKAEYWDSSSSKIVQLFQAGRALLTGQTMEAGEHAKVTL